MTPLIIKKFVFKYFLTRAKGPSAFTCQLYICLPLNRKSASFF